MKIEISLGELVDKVTILAIKLRNIKDEAKLKNISKEYELLSQSMITAGISIDSDPFRRLAAVNARLWEIEDRIREKEARKEFDEKFIELARSVYFNNDERAAIKREINVAYGSDLIEEKEYTSYQ